MGDRALIQFKSGDEISPTTYLHWAGSDVAGLLRKTEKLMKDRDDDVSYSAARFVGVCHENSPGNLSLGIWNQKDELTAEDSHGDAGCFVVDVSTSPWTVNCAGGYGLVEEN